MATATKTAPSKATGRVIQITGAVVDIEFPAGALPAIYNAVEIERKDREPLVCEVQQHLGNNGPLRGGEAHRRPGQRPSCPSTGGRDPCPGRRGDPRPGLRRPRPPDRQRTPPIVTADLSLPIHPCRPHWLDHVRLTTGSFSRPASRSSTCWPRSSARAARPACSEGRPGQSFPSSSGGLRPDRRPSTAGSACSPA